MKGGEIMSVLCGSSASAAEKKGLIESVTPEHITGAFLAGGAEYLLQQAIPLDLNGFDVCGTGGDNKSSVKTFNVSTAVAFVAAAGGVPVIKHGNRAISSQSGSSDVLTALKVPMCGNAGDARRDFGRHGLCFVAAPAFHPALGQLTEVRRSIGRPTFLNLLGPLSNPARTSRQLIGVFHEMFLEPMAEAAQILKKSDVLVVHSDDGLDEISIAQPTQAVRLMNGKRSSMTITPEDSGIARSDIAAIQGGTATHNAAIIEQVFSSDASSPAADIVAMNAAAVFMIEGLDPDLRQGVLRAKKILSSGKAREKLMEMRV